jgi:hypothetical protein
MMLAGLLADPLLQRSAFDQFHDQVRRVVDLARGPHRDDVRMGQAQPGPGFAGEPAAVLVAARQPGGEQFDRSDPAIGVAGAEDIAHAAGTEAALDDETGDLQRRHPGRRHRFAQFPGLFIADQAEIEDQEPQAVLDAAIGQRLLFAPHPGDLLWRDPAAFDGHREQTFVFHDCPVYPRLAAKAIFQVSAIGLLVGDPYMALTSRQLWWILRLRKSSGTVQAEVSSTANFGNAE